MLIVEDDRLLKESLALFFKIRGCKVAAFESSEEALTAIGKDRFDIVIADQMLPGMNGLAFLAKVSVIRPGASRILITGQPSLALVKEAERQGVDDFLRKPFTPEEMEKSIRRLAVLRRTAAKRGEEKAMEDIF